MPGLRKELSAPSASCSERCRQALAERSSPMPVLQSAPHLELRHEVFHVERILHPESDSLPRRQHKIIAVLPAYNAESTLAATLADIPAGSIDEVILVDDGSRDCTVQVARELGLTVIEHERHRGYGGKQEKRHPDALDHRAATTGLVHP